MHVRHLACLALLGAACSNTPSEAAKPHAPTPAPESAADVAAVAESDTPARVKPSVALEAKHHLGFMREVVLSPDGKAALSLDRHGEVRLWPAYEEGTVPFALPVAEPLWMSLAATKTGYLAAFIDTSGGAHVATIDVTDGAARWTTAFDVPPTDPMFELHVLEGGQRILALGVDHRLRLWDAEGATLAELDEHGVIPWQLRVEHDGTRTHAAAVQFSPVRIQRLQVGDDGLKLVGEPQPLAIDQSPNRNDIGMSPDGRYATAMQKPKPKEGRFEIEVVDLHDGTRRMLVAESDTKFRPRVHPRTDAVIAETGSGAAMKLPLEQAVPWQPGADRDALVPIQAQMLSYAGSNDLSMVHTTVRGGVHALAWSDTLRVQSVDGGDAQAVAREGLRPLAVALDADGGSVAWGTHDAVILESLDGSEPARTLRGMGGLPELLAFVGDEQIVAVDNEGTVEIRDLSSDAVLDTKKVPVGWGISQTGWRGAPDGGSIVLSDDRPGGALTVIPVTDGKLGEVATVKVAERPDWPEGGKPRGTESVDWMQGQGMDLASLRLRGVEVIATIADSTSERNVVVQFERGWTFGEGHLTMVEHGERAWVHDTAGVLDAAWSGDGTRFAYADRRGGFVLDASTGSVVYERRVAL